MGVGVGVGVAVAVAVAVAVGVGPETAHTPLLHVPDEQTLSQTPQLLGSVCKLVHMPSQRLGVAPEQVEMTVRTGELVEMTRPIWAVIFAVPASTPVATPVLLIVATAVLSDPQEIVDAGGVVLLG